VDFFIQKTIYLENLKKTEKSGKLGKSGKPDK